MKKILSLCVVGIILAGCTSPSILNKNIKMDVYDKDTKYHIEENDRGFDITILYTRYQFIPESDSVSTACKNQLTSIAWEFSDTKHREIKQINEQRIKISMGRNGFSGITSCGAKTNVLWAN